MTPYKSKTRLFVDAGLTAGGGLDSVLVQQTILAVGAGIYEELVFRLYLITGIMLLLIDVCRVRRSVGVVAAAMTHSAQRIDRVQLDLHGSNENEETD